MKNNFSPSGDQWREVFPFPSLVSWLNAVPFRFANQISLFSMKAILSAPPTWGTKILVSAASPAGSADDGEGVELPGIALVIGVDVGDTRVGVFKTAGMAAVVAVD